MIKKLIICVVLFACSLGAQAQSAPSAKLQLVRLLHAYKSYQASFQQVTYNAAGSVSARNRGRVMLARPGRFRWESMLPTQQTLIANGNILWVYDIDLQQATRRKLTTQDDTVAQLMTGDSAKILADYSVQELAADKSSKVAARRQGQWYRLRPLQTKSKAQGDNLFRKLELHFVAGQLVALRFENSLDEFTAMRFYKIKVNKPLAPHLFSFTPPKGVDILKE